jgi:Na+-transporting NADH:ubiquinone oxidoreductase subunit B
MADRQPLVQRLSAGLTDSPAAATGAAAGAAPEVTGSAPHVRDAFSFESAMRCLMIALIPSIFMAFYNTGFQANVDVTIAGLNRAPGWRGAVLNWLGTGYDPAAFWPAIAHGALYFLPVLVVTVAAGSAWERLFAGRGTRSSAKGLFVIALLFTLLLPPSIPLWQAALGMSFGIVVGKEIFGGTGKNFLNPALVGVAFLFVTYPKEMISETAWTVVDAFTAPTYLAEATRQGQEAFAWLGSTWMQTFVGVVPGAIGTTSTLACIFGAGYLLYRRAVSARVMAGVVIGMIATVWLLNNLGEPANAFVGIAWHWHLTLGAFAFGTVFLATDPVSAAMTNTGRWIYGLLIGAVIVLIRVGSSAHPDGVVFAILFGNIFAPLIDYLVMRANILKRARRNG